MWENEVDMPYLFLHWGFSIVAALLILKLWNKIIRTIPIDFCIRFWTG